MSATLDTSHNPTSFLTDNATKQQQQQKQQQNNNKIKQNQQHKQK